MSNLLSGTARKFLELAKKLKNAGKRKFWVKVLSYDPHWAGKMSNPG